MLWHVPKLFFLVKEVAGTSKKGFSHVKELQSHKWSVYVFEQLSKHGLATTAKFLLRTP